MKIGIENVEIWTISGLWVFWVDHLGKLKIENVEIWRFSGIEKTDGGVFELIISGNWKTFFQFKLLENLPRYCSAFFHSYTNINFFANCKSCEFKILGAWQSVPACDFIKVEEQKMKKVKLAVNSIYLVSWPEKETKNFTHFLIVQINSWTLQKCEATLQFS